MAEEQFGGLGGLGGFVDGLSRFADSDGMNDLLMGLALIDNGRKRPGGPAPIAQVMAPFLSRGERLRDRNMQKEAFGMGLKDSGLSPEQQAAAARNPYVGQMLMQQVQQRRIDDAVNRQGAMPTEDSYRGAPPAEMPSGIMSPSRGRRSDAGDEAAPVRQASYSQDDNNGIPASLIQNESGGRWNAQNNVMGAGGKAGHFGRIQFGQARLEEAKAAGAIPADMTPQQFMASPEAQRSAERWHFADIDNFIRNKGLDRAVGSTFIGAPVTMDAMRAVAHLGGKGGLEKFMTSGGRYNPADKFGTRLSDYFTRHGGRGGGESGGPPATAYAPASAPAPGMMPPTFERALGPRVDVGDSAPRPMMAQGPSPTMNDANPPQIDRSSSGPAVPPYMTPEDAPKLRAEAAQLDQTNPRAAQENRAMADAIDRKFSGGGSPSRPRPQVDVAETEEDVQRLEAGMVNPTYPMGNRSAGMDWRQMQLPPGAGNAPQMAGVPMQAPASVAGEPQSPFRAPEVGGMDPAGGTQVASADPRGMARPDVPMPQSRPANLATAPQRAPAGPVNDGLTADNPGVLAFLEMEGERRLGQRLAPSGPPANAPRLASATQAPAAAPQASATPQEPVARPVTAQNIPAPTGAAPASTAAPYDWRTAQATPEQFDAQQARARGEAPRVAQAGSIDAAPAPAIEPGSPQAAQIIRQVGPEANKPQPRDPGDYKGETTQKSLARNQVSWGMNRIALGGAIGGDRGKALIEQGKAAIDIGKEYLKPTELDKHIASLPLPISPQQKQSLIIGTIDKRPTEQKDYDLAKNDPGYAAYQERMNRSKATNIDNSTRAENAESKGRGEGLAKRMNDIADDGNKAGEDAVFFQRFGDVLSTVKTGKTTETLERIRQLTGITLDPNTDNVQALNALINYAAPRLRVPGSGAQSDRELSNFMASIPGLANTPEGAKQVLETISGVVEYRKQRALIAQEWQVGDISAKVATQRINELPSPFSKPAKAEGKPPPAPAPSSDGWITIDGARVRERR